MPDLVPPSEPPPQLAAVPSRFEAVLQFSGRAAAWIRLRGDFDLAAEQQFVHATEQAFSSALLVIVDLREVTFIDSVGLGALTGADARAQRSGRRLIVVRGTGQVARLCDLVGIPERLQFIDLKSVLGSGSGNPRPQPTEIKRRPLG